MNYRERAEQLAAEYRTVIGYETRLAEDIERALREAAAEAFGEARIVVAPVCPESTMQKLRDREQRIREGGDGE